MRRGRLPLQDDVDAIPDRRARVDEEPSFIAETSFVRAPLNSRVPSTSNVSFNLGLSARAANQKGKGKQDDDSEEEAKEEYEEEEEEEEEEDLDEALDNMEDEPTYVAEVHIASPATPSRTSRRRAAQSVPVA